MVIFLPNAVTTFSNMEDLKNNSYNEFYTKKLEVPIEVTNYSITTM